MEDVVYNNGEEDVCYWDWDEDLQKFVSDCGNYFVEWACVKNNICPECGSKIIKVR